MKSRFDSHELNLIRNSGKESYVYRICRLQKMNWISNENKSIKKFMLLLLEHTFFIKTKQIKSREKNGIDFKITKIKREQFTTIVENWWNVLNPDLSVFYSHNNNNSVKAFPFPKRLFFPFHCALKHVWLKFYYVKIFWRLVVHKKRNSTFFSESNFGTLTL